MRGQMMDRPLLVREIVERAERLFGDREIVSRTKDGVERSTYGEAVRRARRLASSLQRLGIEPGDRVATFGWNSLRHLELYFAVPSMGAVLHTLNIRLFEDDLRYVVEHAEDKVIFLDASLAGVMPQLDSVEHVVLMPDAEGEREGALDYEQLIADGDEGFEFPDFDEDTAAALCYTSGTTGRPKGVLYSHRSAVLHTLVVSLPERLRRARGRLGHAGRADVPRQRLGPAVHGDDGGRAPGAARPADGARRPGRAHRVREGDADGRRADDLAGPAAARPDARPVLAARGLRRRLGRARVPHPRLRRDPRCAR